MQLTLQQNMDLRLVMHETVYMDNTRIGYMVELLNDLNLFSIDPYNGTGEIILKVKKTNIKKQYGIKYSHSAEFYSMIISSIVSRIISRYDKDIINSLRNRMYCNII